jgi:ABC-2 type transport system ATP-binding protein
MSGNAIIIDTENLTKRFRRHEAVHGVNLAVPTKSMFALVGANGAGKTTTLRMLVNILNPDSGSARVCGVDSRRLSPADRLRIGYVSENQEIPRRLSVEQYFEYLRALYPNWDRQLETELRKQFELPSERRLSALSHGMRMKVMLAGALAFRPKLLILDEPLSGLDPLVRDEVMSGLLRQADDTTIVISSHEITEIETCTTHVAFMAKGRLLFQETVESLQARFREVRVSLPHGAPPARYPERWLIPQMSGSSLCFVDTAFVDEEELRVNVTASLGAVSRLEIVPMSLRDVAKAMIRATRTESEV